MNRTVMTVCNSGTFGQGHLSSRAQSDLEKNIIGMVNIRMVQEP